MKIFPTPGKLGVAIKLVRASLILSIPIIVITASSAAAKSRGHRPEPTRAARRELSSAELQAILDGVKDRLGIRQTVTVALVERDPHLVSVVAPRRTGDAFLVQVQQDTLQLLDEDEIAAVLAHELGHVWVFTHHPYLQTELLANQVAMRAVSRDALARVYEKIWKQGGLKGSLAAFLGE